MQEIRDLCYSRGSEPGRRRLWKELNSGRSLKDTEKGNRQSVVKFIYFFYLGEFSISAKLE